MGKAKHEVKVYLTDEQLEAFKKACAVNKQSASEFIRYALHGALEYMNLDFPMPPIERGNPDKKKKGTADK